MFERLKSLPLTIVLTILIWMYAESQVHSSRAESHYTVTDVPVLVRGPAPVLGQYDVKISPPSVSLALAGPTDQIDALRHESPIEGVYAEIDITAEDRPAGTAVQRELHVELPPGVYLAQPGAWVNFRLVPKPAAASAPTATAP